MTGRARARLSAAAALFAFLTLAPATATEPIALRSEAFFYLDNTELFRVYRKTETIFGAWGRVFLSLPIGSNVELYAGVFGNERFGSDDAFELVRPVLALRIGTDRSRFIFGTLETVRPVPGGGPDRLTLHELLPPLQIETLAMTRPHEGGAQWLLESGRVKNDLWLSWQKLNTSEHREVLDAGTAGRVRVLGPVSLAGQAHLIHHGGSLEHVGPVSDSLALAVGATVSPRVSFLDTGTAEVYGLASWEHPDREIGALNTRGRGFLLRLAGTRSGFRAHLIVWHGRDFVMEDGDPNYIARSRDGVFRPGTRRYAEAGLAKVFQPVAGVVVDASARLHRVDSRLGYSYRLVAHVDLDFPLGRPKK